MDLQQLVKTVRLVRDTSRKTEKVRLLSELLRQTEGREAELAAHYLCGTTPQGKIGIGWALLEKAAIEGPAIGERLTLVDVDQALAAVAADRGAGSNERRIGLIGRLFLRAIPEERQFLRQLVIGEIRQGALEGLLLDAIAKATSRSIADVRQAFMYSGNIGEIARAALAEGSDGLARFSLRLFTPISPMLAGSAEDVEDALDRLKEAAFEYKLDGARIQVHKGGDDVRIFTRQLQDITERLPDIVEWARRLPAREAVLDGEAVALRSDGRPHPFQITMRRLGRSKGIPMLRQELPLSPFMFDLLFLNGSLLVDGPFRDRNRQLIETVSTAAVPRLTTSQPDEARRFFQEALAAGHEGIMAKALTASYQAGQRGAQWLKLKEAATLDLVVLAAEWGNGRRTGWLSNLHLGARDGQSGQFVMLGKTFKGLTDDLLRWQTEKLLSLETHRDAHTVYVRPTLVVEIAFSDIQESSRYPGGMALRFARVKRYRPDKSMEEADSLQSVTDLFSRQRS